MKKCCKLIITTVLSLIMVVSFKGSITSASVVDGELEMENVVKGDKDSVDDQNTPKSGGLEVEGEIGDWDPTKDGVSNKLNSLNEDANNGIRPKEGQYYTIAVTVPVNMDFGVYPNSTNVVKGYFYSPEYGLRNHGTNPLRVKVGFEKGGVGDPKSTLYIARPVNGNGNVEIDLVLSFKQSGEEEKKVYLREDRLSNKATREDVGILSSNERAVVTFKADDWEPLSWESGIKDMNKVLTTTGKLIFEFSY